MTWTKQFHRLSVALVSIGLALGVVSVSHAQRFIRPINSIPELIASNPNDPHTNVFIPQGPTGPGLFYQWRKNDAEATNANQSVLGSDWPGASGRWYNIPIAQGSINGISNSGTNGFAVVNTLADLRNMPGNLGIGMVYVRGHAQPDDWGRGFFSRMDDCSTPDDDAYSIHGNDALTCWKRENDLPWSGIPVQYFGGTITVTTINRATEYLESIGGGAAFITDGAWLMDTTNGPIILRNSVTIAGSASAILVGDGYGTMFGGTNIHNAQILELGISNVITGVLIRGGTNILIGGNSFFKFGDGVRQYGGDDVRIEVNRFAEGTNGIHLSLDGAVQVTQGAMNGNTFSGIVNSNVLADVGSTEGYQRYDSGTDFRLARTNSVVWMGTNKVLVGTPGKLMLGPTAMTEYDVITYPIVGLARDMRTGETDFQTAMTLVGYDASGGYHENYIYLDDGTWKGGHVVNVPPNSGYEIGVRGTNFQFYAYIDGRDRMRLVPGADAAWLRPEYLFDTALFVTVSNILEVFNNQAVSSNTLPRFGVGHSGYFQTLEAVAPGAPPSGAGYWYASSADNKPHYIADDGTDYDLTSSAAGTTINATDGVMPYRLNATTFADSPLKVVGGVTGDILPSIGGIALGNYGDEFSGVYSTFLTGVDIYVGDFALDRGLRTGVGDPNGVANSPNAGGSLYLREDGPPWVYIKTTLSDLTLTGWEAVSSGSGAGPAFSDLVWTNNAGVVQLVTQTNRINLGGTANMPTGTGISGDPGPDSRIGGEFQLSAEEPAFINFRGSVDPDTGTPIGIKLGFSEVTTNTFGASYGAYFYNYSHTTNAGTIYFRNEVGGGYGLIAEKSSNDPVEVLIPGQGVGLIALGHGDDYWNIGLVAYASAQTGNQTNISLIATAPTFSASTGIQIALYAEQPLDDTVDPIFTESSVALFDNRNSTNALLILKTNEVEVARIAADGRGIFAKNVTVPAEVYDATGWDADLSVPTKDAVRDKIESLTGASLLAFQQIGSGTDYSLTDTFARVVFGTTGADIVLTNAGTYQIIYTVAAFANNTFAQQYYLRNTTDSVDVPGSYQEVNVSSTSSPLVLAVLYTTSAANKTIQIWGKTMDLTYAGAPKVISTNTVAVVTKF